MSGVVAVVGATGRVGSAISDRLARRFDVRRVGRDDDDDVDAIARRAAAEASVVVNAAGVAHVEHDDEDTLRRLQAGNVELPVAIARRALAAGASFIHISSVKAATPDGSPYAASKREGEERLAGELGDAYAAASLSLTVVRPLALLFRPLDAGKVARLRFVRRWPSVLTPAVRLPVLAPEAFLDVVESLVAAAVSGSAPPGCTIREFARSERGTLRDVRAAFR